jgi:uncharacterized protein with PIN domain
MNVVLDASAMIALLRGEAGAEAVSIEIGNPASNALAHALNLCEVYYDFARASGEGVAAEAINDFLALGIKERNDMHDNLKLNTGLGTRPRNVLEGPISP